MKIVLITAIMAVVIFVLFQKLMASSFANNYSNPDIPATWNLDWQGGPGYDRYKILTEEGPYNPGGWTSTEI
jgi:hypothetical protein